MYDYIYKQRIQVHDNRTSVALAAKHAQVTWIASKQSIGNEGKSKNSKADVEDSADSNAKHPSEKRDKGPEEDCTLQHLTVLDHGIIFVYTFHVLISTYYSRYSILSYIPNMLIMLKVRLE